MKIPLVSDNAAITTNNEETLIVNILNAGILTATNIIIIVNNVIIIVWGNVSFLFNSQSLPVFNMIF